MILKMHNLTPSAFADQLGVQRSNVSHVMSGRNKPSLDFLEKIIVTYPRVNAHWLITGVMSKEELGRKKEDIALKVEDQNTHKLSGTIDKSKKDIVKIVAFYADETFIEYYPPAPQF
jgi:transcriptional regulator with XRE-family HTH domain